MPTAIPQWNKRVLAKVESAFGTAELPVAASGLEVINLSMGPSEAPVVRPKKDKTAGRDQTLEFVQGRVEPIAFSLDTSVKSRATATTVMKESALLKAAGLVETVGGSDVTYGLSSDPTIPGLSIHAVGGEGTGTRFGEVGYGGIIKSLEFIGGDQELILKAGGAFAGKYVQGQALVTFADGSTTAGSFGTAAHAYRFTAGSYCQVESEVVKITAINYGAGTFTATRAQAGTTGAAHTGVAMYPYMPTPTVAGSPISEALHSVTLDGVTMEARDFSVTVQTGIEHLPLATGSARVQGAYAKRVEVMAKMSFAFTDEEVQWMGKAAQRKAVALSIVAGTAAGGIFTFGMPTCEVIAFEAPDVANDICIVELAVRVRGSSGGDSFSLVAS